MIYDNLSGLVRVLVVGSLAYVWLLLVLRISGKRTLAQLNAFDFIVTVALGSTLATVTLSNSVAWTEGRWRWLCSPRSSSSRRGCRSVSRGCGG